MGYSFARFHDIKIPAGQFLSLLKRLPDTIHARLPYLYQAVVISAAANMQTRSFNGEAIKLGNIYLCFASDTNAQASGDLLANLVV